MNDTKSEQRTCPAITKRCLCTQSTLSSAASQHIQRKDTWGDRRHYSFHLKALLYLEMCPKYIPYQKTKYLMASVSSCVISPSYFCFKEAALWSVHLYFRSPGGRRDFVSQVFVTLWSAVVNFNTENPTSYFDWSGAWVLCACHILLCPHSAVIHLPLHMCDCAHILISTWLTSCQVQGGSTRTFKTREYTDDRETRLVFVFNDVTR